MLYHHRVLHRALEQAVRWQLIPRNPADAVEPPRARRPEIQALTEDQVRAMLEAAKGTRYYTLLLLAVATGMRRGELLALRWQDVDLKAGRITVCRSLQYTKERGIFFKEPKNPGSRRTVEISPPVVEALRRHRKEQAGQKLALAPLYEDQDLVFEQGNGRPLFPDTITAWFPRVMERAGLPRVSFHALRHTHVTLLLKAGVPVRVVSDRVGHARVRITLDTYSHVLPGMQKDAAAKLDGILFGDRAPIGHRSGRESASGNK